MWQAKPRALRTVAASLSLEQRRLLLWESIPPPVTSTCKDCLGGSGFCIRIAQNGSISAFGDARSDHHLLGRSNKKGMSLISLSAGIIRPFIFRTSWFRRGARGKVDIGTIQAAAFQPSACPSHFAVMIYVWPCNTASLGSTAGIYPAPCH